jgi:DAACS family dicarboxylate/amino acid:cation (Na+ or H+) symporter
MLIGLVVGLVGGLLAHFLAPGAAWVDWVARNVAAPVGQIFLRLLFMLVIPLILSALVVGVAGIDLRELGRLGLRVLAYATGVSFIAASIGLLLVNVIQPGSGEAAAGLRELARSTAAPAASGAAALSGVGLIVAMVPDNPVKAASQGDMLALMIFALIFGVALAHTRTEGAEKFKGMVQGLFDVSMTLIEGVLKLAPVGIGALLFALFAQLGLEIFVQLGAYVGVVLLGLGLHMFGFYPLTLRLAGGMGSWEFFKKSRLAMLTAFSTASSSATLPTALSVAETELKLPAHVSRFVLTAGSTSPRDRTSPGGRAASGCRRGSCASPRRAAGS